MAKGNKTRPNMRSREERDVLIRQWLPLVKHVARKLESRKDLRGLGTIDDLIQVGTLGLIRAAELYDPANGASFKTYAYSSIASRIIRDGRTAGLIHIPHYYGETRERKKPRWYAEMAECAAHFMPLFPRGRECHELSRLPDKTDYDPELADRAVSYIADLDERDALIVRLRFGLEDGYSHTLQEIADRVGRSKERVRQIEHRIIKWLRNRFGVTQPPAKAKVGRS